MIQEKDFLYRVPVKNVLVTTPRQQVRNPEILVDLEGGEFMHGNILDANSTNKLINQSVKDAVDNKLIESGYVTQGLLDAETTRATEQENSLKTLIGAETSARTKGDEDLSAKIKAEQTRAEGKEKEISDKLAIVDGDSNTEGSFRKAIADVIAAAPEDLDTLKEIADKLADNDDLHTALNQAITDKADASALLNEVTRATGAESNLQAAIDTKADATALSNYVLTAALNKQVDTLNTAISAKQDAGKYISYNKADDVFYYLYNIGIISKSEDGSAETILCPGFFEKSNEENSVTIRDGYINISNNIGNIMTLNNDDEDGGIVIYKQLTNSIKESLRILEDGIRLMGGDNNHVLTSNASTIDITEYAKKTELPTVPTKTSQLTNDSNFITAADIDFTPYATIVNLSATESMLNTRIDGKQDKGNYMEYSSKDDYKYTINGGIIFGAGNTSTDIQDNGIIIRGTNGKTCILDVELLQIAGDSRTTYSINGITSNQHHDCLATSDGSFKPISDFVLKEEADEEYVTQNQLDDIKVGLAKKQDKIKVNSVDVTNLETADITQLRAIVKDLLTALSDSGLIRETSGLE